MICRYIISLAAGCVLSVQPTFAAEVYTIPAHWVEESGELEPRVFDFSFRDLAFWSPTDGWIVGDRFFLHIMGEALSLTFVEDPTFFFNTIAVPSYGEAWAGGMKVSHKDDEALLWRYRDDVWEPVDLRVLELAYTSIATLAFETPDRGWALVSRREQGSDAITTTGFLHFDGARWQRHMALPENILLNDMCVDTSGAGWAVGYVKSTERQLARGVALRKVEDQWQEVDLTDVPDGAWVLNEIVCTGNGGAVATGRSKSIDTLGKEEESFLLLRTRGTWKRVPLPESRKRHDAANVTVANGDIWVTVSPPLEPGIFLRLTDDKWTEVPMPTLPEESLSGVLVTSMVFVSPTQGWAVAEKHWGGGYLRGLVFQYQDGAWRNRNWNWHFWDQRRFGWLGLFGF